MKPKRSPATCHGICNRAFSVRASNRGTRPPRRFPDQTSPCNQTHTFRDDGTPGAYRTGAAVIDEGEVGEEQVGGEAVPGGRGQDRLQGTQAPGRRGRGVVTSFSERGLRS